MLLGLISPGRNLFLPECVEEMGFLWKKCENRYICSSTPVPVAPWGYYYLELVWASNSGTSYPFTNITWLFHLVFKIILLQSVDSV